MVVLLLKLAVRFQLVVRPNTSPKDSAYEERWISLMLSWRSGPTVEAVNAGEKREPDERSEDLSRSDWSADLRGSEVGQSELERAETEPSPAQVVSELDHRHEKREGLNRFAAGS